MVFGECTSATGILVLPADAVVLSAVTEMYLAPMARSRSAVSDEMAAMSLTGLPGTVFFFFTFAGRSILVVMSNDCGPKSLSQVKPLLTEWTLASAAGAMATAAPAPSATVAPTAASFVMILEFTCFSLVVSHVR